MYFFCTLIESREVFEEYLILYFIQKCVLSCWKQTAPQAVGSGPGCGGEMKALVLLHYPMKVLLLQPGVCVEAEWDPLKSPCPLLIPHGAGSGRRQLGWSEAKPRISARTGTVCASLPAPWLSIGNLSSSQWLGIHCCLWAPCRSCYTNAKEALHPKSLKVWKIHICSPFAAPRNWGVVSKWGTFLNFCAAELKSK